MSEGTTILGVMIVLLGISILGLMIVLSYSSLNRTFPTWLWGAVIILTVIPIIVKFFKNR
jgi:hypothetical protein